MIGSERPVLSLAALEAFDPAPGGAGAERRFNCPLPACSGKPADRAHQCFNVNVESGLWVCHRCGARGQLVERWAPRPTSGRALREARRQAALRTIRIPPERSPGTAPSAALLPGLLAHCRPVARTPGQAYLYSRGIDPETAIAAGVLWTADCYGRPGVVFRMADRGGAVVAVNCRYVDRASPKTRSIGDRSLACFGTPGALATPTAPADGPLVVVEGPLDALSLACCDVPCVALVATVAPPWLGAAAAFRRVYVALDADDAGDRGSDVLADELAPFARTIERLRPPPWRKANGEPGKDWSDALVSPEGGYGALCEWLEAYLGA